MSTEQQEKENAPVKEETETTTVPEETKEKKEFCLPDVIMQGIKAGMVGRLTTEQTESILDQIEKEIVKDGTEAELLEHVRVARQTIERGKLEKIRDEVITLAIILHNDPKKRAMLLEKVGITTTMTKEMLGFVLNLKFQGYTKEALEELKTHFLSCM